MVFIHPTALDCFSISFEDDLLRWQFANINPEDGLGFDTLNSRLSEKEKADKRHEIFIFNCCKIALWIPAISLIAAAVFVCIAKDKIKDLDPVVKFCVTIRLVLSIFAPVLMFVDIAGTAVKSIENARIRKRFRAQTI